MTIRAEKSQVILMIISRVSIDMINFEGNFMCESMYFVPAAQTALFTSIFNQILFEVFRYVFCLKNRLSIFTLVKLPLN